MKHNKQWYIDIHNTIAGVGLIALLLGVVIICGILETI